MHSRGNSAFGLLSILALALFGGFVVLLSSLDAFEQLSVSDSGSIIGLLVDPGMVAE